MALVGFLDTFLVIDMIMMDFRLSSIYVWDCQKLNDIFYWALTEYDIEIWIEQY